VLRACHDVLKPGGRIAGYTIHTPQGLSESQGKRASELGPSEVLSEASPVDLLRAASFNVIVEQDVTEHFRATCEAILRARSDLESKLRNEEGDALFEEEQEGRTLKLRGITEGLLQRSLIVAIKT
jgi:hypothetical protein